MCMFINANVYVYNLMCCILPVEMTLSSGKRPVPGKVTGRLNMVYISNLKLYVLFTFIFLY